MSLTRSKSPLSACSDVGVGSNASLGRDAANCSSSFFWSFDNFFGVVTLTVTRRSPCPRPPVEILARVSGVNDVQTFGDRAHVRIDPVARAQVIAAIEAALRGASIQDVSVRPIAASLEDVFIDLITGSRR